MQHSICVSLLLVSAAATPPSKPRGHPKLEKTSAAARSRPKLNAGETTSTAAANHTVVSGALHALSDGAIPAKRKSRAQSGKSCYFSRFFNFVFSWNSILMFADVCSFF